VTKQIMTKLTGLFAYLLVSMFVLPVQFSSAQQNETKTVVQSSTLPASLSEHQITLSKIAALALTVGELKETIKKQDGTIDGLRAQIEKLKHAATGKSTPVDQMLGFKYRPRIRTIFFTFSNDTTPTLIPGSERATFCALSWVDDRSEKGSCKIYTENSTWFVQSGDSYEHNQCAAACLFLD
jgi:hypothetical protein